MDALLVIDVQQAIITGCYRDKEVLDAINHAAERIRSRNGLVIYIQHCHSSYEPMKKGNSGWQLHPSLTIKENDLFVEKTASDSFYRTDLEALLRDRGVDHLFITGLQTEYCVDASCRSALSKDFEVTLVSDGHTTGHAFLKAQQTIEHHNNVLSNLAHPTNQIALSLSSDV